MISWGRQGGAEIPEKVSMVLEAFQDSRMLADPVLADQSFLSPGITFVHRKSHRCVMEVAQVRLAAV